MMGNANGRLGRLERHVPGGCDDCHRWGPSAHEIVRNGIPVRATRPETCATCGRRVPIITLRRIVITRVESAEDLT